MQGKTQYSLITSLIGAGTTILLSNFLIASWGMTGVAVAQLVGATVMFGLRYWIARRIARFSLRFAIPVLQSVLFAASGMACMRWGWAAIGTSLIINGGVALTANRALIASVWSALKGKLRR